MLVHKIPTQVIEKDHPVYTWKTIYFRIYVYSLIQNDLRNIYVDYGLRVGEHVLDRLHIIMLVDSKKMGQPVYITIVSRDVQLESVLILRGG